MKRAEKGERKGERRKGGKAYIWNTSERKSLGKALRRLSSLKERKSYTEGGIPVVRGLFQRRCSLLRHAPRLAPGPASKILTAGTIHDLRPYGWITVKVQHEASDFPRATSFDVETASRLPPKNQPLIIAIQWREE